MFYKKETGRRINDVNTKFNMIPLLILMKKNKPTLSINLSLVKPTA